MHDNSLQNVANDTRGFVGVRPFEQLRRAMSCARFRPVGKTIVIVCARKAVTLVCENECVPGGVEQTKSVLIFTGAGAEGSTRLQSRG